MKWIICAFVIVCVFQGVKCELDTEAIIRIVNSEQSSWKAGYNARFHNADDDYVKMHMGTHIMGESELKELAGKNWPTIEEISVPAEFDLREEYSECKTINEVRDQGACGSCWAIAAVEAMSDRYCIQLNKFLHLSTLDVLSCCSWCGQGCHGGHTIRAWQFWTETGVVTGGTYNTSEGCQPYPLAKCSHHVEGRFPKCGSIIPTPECLNSCEEEYGGYYWTDKHFGANSYMLPQNQTVIMMEIMTRGSVEASFHVYRDFLTYKSGVYAYTTGNYTGGHAVKLLGWGTENEVDYWQAVNSWNTDWGDNGFFKIKRGVNECGIEGGIVAGMALN